jgi:NAD(P)-dependent dehydrogenase (short-subunit alcohol dehydrogenase family)
MTHVHCIANMRVTAFLYRYDRDVRGLPEAGARRVMDTDGGPAAPGRRSLVTKRRYRCRIARRRSRTARRTMMDFDGIGVVVTGGASGLGLATARAFAAEGAKVAIFDMNEAVGAEVVKEFGGTFCHVNVIDEASIEAGFAKARAANGQERVLVNCAGGGGSVKTASRDKKTGEIRHFPLDMFERIIQVNLIGTFRCIAKSAAGMLTLDALPSGERGAIVCTASAAAEDGQTGQAAYSASKGGIVGMTLPIARDLSREGIRINTILPGIFDTPLMNGAPENVKTALAASIPFPKRFGAPAEYASLALEMCRNPYFNAEDVRLDGGIRMGYQ